LVVAAASSVVAVAVGEEVYLAKVYGESEKTRCCAIVSRLKEIRRLDSCAQKLSARRLSAQKLGLMLLNAQVILLDHVACSISGIWALALAVPGRLTGSG
jgi:predicted membrane-bound spermidine synthase